MDCFFETEERRKEHVRTLAKRFLSMTHLKQEVKTLMKKDRKYYEALFADYPDLVTVVQFRQMLNGVGDKFARKLIQEKRVIAFFIKPYYYVPKSSVIRYVLRTDYAKRKLKVRV